MEKILKYEDVIDEIHLYDNNSGYGRNLELARKFNITYTAIINSDDCWEPQKLEKQGLFIRRCGIENRLKAA